MSVYTIFELYGKEFNDFWSLVKKEHPEMPNVWYEVYVDFFDEVYNKNLSLEANIEIAYEYIIEHQNDYD